jgi:hypothetical protein
MNVNAQGLKGKFKVMEVTPNGVMVAGKVVERYDTLEGNGAVVWRKSNAHMILKPLADTSFKEKGEKWPCEFYKGVLYKVRDIYKNSQIHKNEKLLWWMKRNKSSGKGGDVIFDGEHFMYEDELVIELPGRLMNGQGYKFESVSTGRCFYSKNHDKYPLILITRDMLDSVGFDGEPVKLKVYFINNYDEKLVTELMVVTVK